MPQRALADRFCARVKTREGEAQTDYFGETTAWLAPRITRSGPAILKVGIWSGCPVSFDSLDFHQLGRDGEGGEGFEEDGPGGKDRVGGDRGQMVEEAGSLRRGLACSDPGRLQQFERSVPGEGEEVQARQHHRQKALAMAEIVFELVAVIFHHVEAFVLDLPARPAAGERFRRYFVS